MQGVEEVVDVGNGVGILDCSCVELPEVNAEPETTVFLFHHDDRRGPGAVRGTDDASRKHLLYLRHLFSANGWVLAAVWLAER